MVHCLGWCHVMTPFEEETNTCLTCLETCLYYAYWKRVVVSNIFYFLPYLGKISNLTNIFQMGWNHQLAFILLFGKCGVLLQGVSMSIWGQDPRGLSASKRSYHFLDVQIIFEIYDMYIYIYMYIHVNPAFLCHFEKNILCLYEKISQTTCHYPKHIFSQVPCRKHVTELHFDSNVWNWYKGGPY